MVLFVLLKSLVQVRIFPYNGGHSREIYHTKRMQRFACFPFLVHRVFSFSLASQISQKNYLFSFLGNNLLNSYIQMRLMPTLFMQGILCQIQL